MPKEFSRTERIAELLQRSLSILIQQTLQDPRLHGVIVTITRVTVTKDLMHSKVMYSFLDENTKPETQLMVAKCLDNASGFLRHMIAMDSDLRRVPALHFVYDPSLVRAEHIYKLLEESNDDPTSKT